MQGETTQAQEVRTIRTLECQDIDLICLVRGGGFPLNLTSFVGDEVGRAIALCRKPVWVGIWHEINVTVPNFVAHQSHKTPMAVAVVPVQHFQELDAGIKTHQERLEDSCERSLLLTNRKVSRNENGLRQRLRKHVQHYQTHFHAIDDRIRGPIRKRIAGEQTQLANHEVRLREGIGRILAGKTQSLNQSLMPLSCGATSRLVAASKDIEQRVAELRQLARVVEQ